MSALTCRLPPCNAEGRVPSSWKSLSFAAVSIAACVALLVSASASAASSAPAWRLRSVAYPSDFSASDDELCEAQSPTYAYEFCDTLVVSATNIGANATGSTTVTLKDTVPAGLTVRGIALFVEQGLHTGSDLGETYCTLSPAECKVPLNALAELAGASVNHTLPPDGTLRMYVSVTVPKATPQGTVSNTVSVSAPGTTEVTSVGASTVDSGAPAFGPTLTEISFLGTEGQPYSLAGGHPYELNTVIALGNALGETPPSLFGYSSVSDLRDVIVDLPVGMTGSAVAAPQCTLARMSARGESALPGESECPHNTIVGHIRTLPENGSAADTPVYNLVPEGGHAAELGFKDLTGSTHVLYLSLAPSPSGYVLRATSKEIPQIMLVEVIANLYGNPSARDDGTPGASTLTYPSQCTGEPLVTTVMMDSWQHPGSYNSDGSPNLSDPNWVAARSSSPPVVGCEQLAGLFEPSLTMAPTTTRADSPSGLDLALTIPQDTGAEGQSTPPLRDTTITLPEGLAVNPSSANGLEACSLVQVGISETGIPNAAPPACPDGSKLGTVEVETPSLANEVCKSPQTPLEECPAPGEREHVALTGSIYLARQDENPFHSLIALYIVVDDPRTGIIAKLAGKVTPDPVTGQLTATVADSPQFPFSVLRTSFFEGDTAALTTPADCDTYTTTGALTPWSAPESGPPANLTSTFTIGEAADGSACKQPTFAPTLAGGTTNTQARAHTNLTLTFSRQDTEQPFLRSSISTPLGLLGTIAGIPQCPEAQANSGTCASASLLGEATTAVGSGPHPYWVKGGQVFLTGPYKGAPFGLSILVPTTAGPFTLTGNAGSGREVVRAAIHIDPHTDRITVQSDDFPTIIEGIPLAIRTVNVTINRPNFIFNPTNCSQQETTATFTSTAGTTSTASVPYYASGCSTQSFKPTITATTQAHTSRPDGASLTLSITAHPGEANIAKTELEIPAQLPARENTLKHACLAKVFQANPAGCPPESIVGTATVTTPVLSSPLTGPIYIVSYGSEGFPRTDVVLQGENGLMTILEGHTLIKNSVTYSNFSEVPDVPFTSFIAKLPSGPHSIFGAYLPETNNNPCGHHLSLPTHMTGQNNKQHNPTVTVAVTGCPSDPRIQSVALQRNKLTLRIYTPTAGTLRITAKRVHIDKLLHTAKDALQVTTFVLPRRHPKKLALTLTTTTSSNHRTTTHTIISS